MYAEGTALNRTKAGEVDLIAELQGLLAFIDVKARPSPTEAAFALGLRQRTRLVAADGTIRRIAVAFRADDA